MGKIQKSEEEWQKELDPKLYEIARKKGTEAPFSGELTYSKERGIYTCAVCGNPLFSSETKFDSGTGWPSFSDTIPGAVETHEDIYLGMSRTEIVCARCGSHLGHVFDDGPAPTRKRYCLNSVCLDLQREDSKK